MRTRIALVAGAGVVVAAVVTLARLRAARSRRTNAGADAADMTRALPGDDIAGQPVLETTRVVRIDAWPEEVWPWIEQGEVIGGKSSGRGGGAGPNVRPGYRMLQAGDRVSIGLRGGWRLRVKGLEWNKWMLWWDEKGSLTWSWGLYASPDGGTTLVTRVRARKDRRALRTLVRAVMDPDDPFGIADHLEGIKARAEAVAGERRERLEATGMLLSQAMQSA